MTPPPTKEGGVTLRPSDAAVLRALADGPLSTREVADRILREACEAWAEEKGYDIEWFTDDEPAGARLLATGQARDAGLLLLPHEIGPRLVALERRGLVVRIQVEGHRPMLWCRP